MTGLNRREPIGWGDRGGGSRSYFSRDLRLEQDVGLLDVDIKHVDGNRKGVTLA